MASILFLPDSFPYPRGSGINQSSNSKQIKFRPLQFRKLQWKITVLGDRNDSWGSQQAICNQAISEEEPKREYKFNFPSTCVPTHKLKEVITHQLSFSGNSPLQKRLQYVSISQASLPFYTTLSKKAYSKSQNMQQESSCHGIRMETTINLLVTWWLPC